MGILYEKVKFSKEAQRQVIIKELLVLGITDFQNQSLEELDYYTLRHALSVARIRVESDENKWF